MKIVKTIPNPRNKAVTVLLSKTGWRLKEVLEIKMEDLMLEDGFVRIREQKGGKQTVVPIDREPMRTIRRFQIIRPDTDLDYPFVSIRDDRLTKTVIQRAVREAAVSESDGRGRRSVSRNIHAHTFRTVFTTLMGNPGTRQHVLQYICGDAESETMDIYTTVDRDEAREEDLNCIKPLGR